MKIASALYAVAAASLLLAGDSSGSAGAESGRKTPEDPAQADAEWAAAAATRSLASAFLVLDPENEGSEDGFRVRGGGAGHRSLACKPAFSGIFPTDPTKEVGIAPIGKDRRVMFTTKPGTTQPPAFNWYGPDTNPFVICNRLYQLAFPGMVGYTFRAFSDLLTPGGGSNGCREVGDYYVDLKLYDVVKKKVLRRQREVSPPYVLYGNKFPIPQNNTNLTEYGSALLPNGLYQVYAAMYLTNGTLVDKTDFGSDILVVSC
jgi:hypothetical protein